MIVLVGWVGFADVKAHAGEKMDSSKTIFEMGSIVGAELARDKAGRDSG
ncbi:hypothetical protein [Pseudomonas quasicaspiana]|nr:hypothetical protein [Pseudomonas quasicaspiana]MCD5972669.1 hypothetical protein [Pseudomonas quasicaspiana]